MAEVYINDAFGVSHRAHASVEGISKHFDMQHKAAGFLMAKEIKFFHHIVHNPKRPFVSIVGGSKVFQKLLNHQQDIKMAPGAVCDDTLQMAKDLQAGEILLLENMRFELGETKNDPVLCEKLASMAEIYINAAFGVSHRALLS